MTVNVNQDDNKYDVNIDGVIKSVSDSQSIKDALNSCTDSSKDVNINISNSFSVTSSVIGFFLKKVQADNLNITINVTDDRLFELFETLNLTEILNVKKA
ncbi:MAG: hypothetical protein OIF32_08455 [Campylobacterales bacterium]|nr:hypothetical protein [Campylobacterales bacterium]